MTKMTESGATEGIKDFLDSEPSFSYQIWFYDGLKAALDGQLPLPHGKLRRKRGAEIAKAYKTGYRAGQQLQRQNGNGELHPRDPLTDPLNAHADSWFVKGLLDSAMGNLPKNESILRCRYGDEAANAYWDGYEALYLS